MNDADWIRKRVRNLGRGCLGGVLLFGVGLGVLGGWVLQAG